MSSDGVVEDDYFLDARHFFTDERFDFGVVCCSDCFVVCEGFLLSWRMIYTEARDVGAILIFIASDIVDGVFVVF